MQKTAFLNIILISLLSLSTLTCAMISVSRKELLPKISTEIGKQLPEIEVETLQGKKMKLPFSKASLLLVGFDEDASKQAREWLLAIRKDRLLPEAMNVSIVPVLGNGFTVKLMRPFLFQAVKKAVPAKEHSNVYLSFTNPKTLKALLCANQKPASTVFLVLVDATGKIVWTHSGKVSAQSKKDLLTLAKNVIDTSADIAQK